MLTIAILFGSLVTTVVPTTTVLAYETSQAGSLPNMCSGDQASGVICVNDSLMIQGDENIVSTPISSQITSTVKQGP